MRITATLSIGMTLLLSTFTAGAHPYLGAAAGMSMLKPNIDKNQTTLTNKGDFSYRAHLGYQMSNKFGFELLYADLGKLKYEDSAKQAFSTPFKFAGAAVVYAPFASEDATGFNWLLELGIGSLEIDEAVISKENQYQAVLGTGIAYNFTANFGTRLLIENFDKNVNLATLGVSYLFGSKSKPPVVLPEPEPVVEVAAAPAVVAEPVVLDSDNDGVPDNIDCCPNTAGGLIVNSFGCPTLEQKLQNINFVYKSQALTTTAKLILDGIFETMQLYPTARIEIGAYTDSIGSDQYNLKLSQKRAESARSYLIFKGINDFRLTARGYGEVDPIADNDTEDGRAANRRVELKLIDKGEGIRGCNKQ